MPPALLLALLGAVVAAVVAYDEVAHHTGEEDEWEAFLAAHIELHA